MRAVKSVSIDSERRVIITYLDGSTETLYPNCIWCDSEALRQLIKDLLEEKADAITQTIENVTIASFADGADEGLIKKLLVSIEPIQEGSGDPSPENVRPISGRTGLSVVRTGKNLFDVSAVGAEPDFVYLASNIIKETNRLQYDTIGAGAVIRLYRKLPAGSYVFSAKVKASDGGYVATAVYINGSKANNAFTLQEETVVDFRFIGTDATEAERTVEFYDIQLELGSAATGYEPYEGNTYTINWETEAGTVYGGTLDVVSGKLVVDWTTADMGQYDWAGKNGTFSFYLHNISPSWARNSIDWMRCSAYKPESWNSIDYGTHSDYSIHGLVYNDDTVLRVYDSRYQTVEDFKSGVLGTQFAYELATPIEIQLTPQEIRTLLGDNNIWSDSGNILELEYTADTKLYIGESQVGRTSSAQQSINKPVEFDTTIVKPVTEVTEKEQIEEEE